MSDLPTGDGRGDNRDKVVQLPGDYEPAPDEEKVSPPGRLHGIFITGMAVSALVGVASMFAFITVGWPERVGRYVIALFLFSGLVFLACASAAVFTAARDTYPTRRGNPLD